ncbi:MAG: hypothetical protein K0U38_01310 [Epsilonproteobacteria bacterium]|nr:hypothetical protein [Campylobacterota bacterium]
MKTKKLLLACLFIAGVSTQITVAEENIVKGTTIGFEHCVKPGAPIDMTYETPKRVEVNEVATVNIALTTTLKTGEMEVDITLDEALESADEMQTRQRFNISAEQKEYTLAFRVSAKEEGLYYIRLLTKVESGDGARMRALAVPVYVGEGKLKKKGEVIMKALGGENISVSKAQETIEIIED